MQEACQGQGDVGGGMPKDRSAGLGPPSHRIFPIKSLLYTIFPQNQKALCYPPSMLTKTQASFYDTLLECACNTEFVREFDRLTNSNLSLKGSQLIDKTSGRLDVELGKFVEFVHEFVWLRTKVPVNPERCCDFPYRSTCRLCARALNRNTGFSIEESDCPACSKESAN